MFSLLKENYKRSAILLILLLTLILNYFIVQNIGNFYLKFFLLLVLLAFFLTFLTIFEIMSSLIENFLLWLIISLFLAFFYLPSVFVIMPLAFLKILLQKNILQSSINPPFFQLVVRNYIFIFFVAITIFSFYFYQNYVYEEAFPITFDSYQSFLSSLDKFLAFWGVNVPWQEKIFDIITNYFKKNPNAFNSDIMKNFLFIINKAIIIDKTTLQDFFYQIFSSSWQNEKVRQVVLFAFFSSLFFILYPLIRISSGFIGLIALLFYHLCLRIGFIKINYKSINKEFLEF